MALESGERLGPYEIQAPIGAGGMGDVYRARDTRLDRTVAIKVSKEDFSARFYQEARAVAALNHAHICVLYDIGPNYLVMEYIDGTPLKGPLPLEEALPLALQIVSAVEEAHSKGVVHRDLKPSNILVTKSGVKLLDFGLAKVNPTTRTADDALTVTRAGTVMGTPAYMSPEQASGAPADERCDIFSFGAVLYEMLSGRRAFGGQSQASTLAAVLRDDPAPLSTPHPISQVVYRCLQKDPANRYQTARDLRNALEETRSKAADTRASIAVLAFANLSRDEDGECFSDGLAEEIINLLAQVPNLKVIARTSAFAFKGQNEDVRKVAQTLGVAHILEGSVRRAGRRIRVVSQLIAASDGSHVWSQRFEGELADVFAIQDEIAQAIVAALQIKLAGPVSATHRYTANLVAYEAFLKGRRWSFIYTPDAMAKSRASYEQAIELEPGFALAHAELGMQILLGALPGVTPARDAMPLARGFAQKALSLDASLPEARAVLGAVAGLYDYDWQQAGHQFRLATAQHSVHPYIRFLFGGFALLPCGEIQRAVREIETGLDEDPLNFAGQLSLGFCRLALSQFSEAEAIFRKLADEHASAFQPFHFVAISYAAQGRFADAIPFAEKAHAVAPGHSHPTAVLAAVLAETGESAAATALIDGLPPAYIYGTPMAYVMYHLIRSQTEEAAAWAAKAIDQRDPRFLLGFRFPLASALRASSHGTVLAGMIKLPVTKLEGDGSRKMEGGSANPGRIIE